MYQKIIMNMEVKNAADIYSIKYTIKGNDEYFPTNYAVMFRRFLKSHQEKLLDDVKIDVENETLWITFRAMNDSIKEKMITSVNDLYNQWQKLIFN